MASCKRCIKQIAAMVTHLVRPGADMGMSEVLLYATLHQGVEQLQPMLFNRAPLIFRLHVSISYQPAYKVFKKQHQNNKKQTTGGERENRQVFPEKINRNNKKRQGEPYNHVQVGGSLHPNPTNFQASRRNKNKNRKTTK